MATKSTVISLGYRQSRIASTTALQSFGINPVMHGFKITMENGDEFGFYNENREYVERMKPGLYVTYEYLKIIEHLPGGDKVKFRIENYTLDLPRKERAEAVIVPRILDARAKSVELAMQAYIDSIDGSGMWRQSYFEEIADGIFLYYKTKILEETFDFQESDSKILVGSKKKGK